MASSPTTEQGTKKTTNAESADPNYAAPLNGEQAMADELNVDPPELEVTDPEPDPGHPGQTTWCTVSVTNGVPTSFSLVNPAWGATVDPNTGYFSFTPEWSQLNAFNFTVRGKNVEADTALAPIPVTIANAQPTIAELTNRTAHPGLNIWFQVEAQDVDSDQLTFSIDDPPFGARIDPNNGHFQWTPGWNQVGPHTLTFRVKDPSDGPGATRSCVITVQNEAPRLKDRPATNAHPGVEVAFTVELEAPTNPDDVSDPCEFSIINPPAGASIDPAYGYFRWTPSWSQVRSHNVSIRAKDPAGQVGTKVYVINVQNQAPVISNAPTGVIEVDVGQNYSYTIETDDAPDKGSHRFYLIDPPYGAQIDAFYGYLTWTPEDGQQGDHTIRVRVLDPGGLWDEESFTIRVS